MKMFDVYSITSENGNVVVYKQNRKWGVYGTMKEAWDDVLEDYKSTPIETGEL